MCAGSWIYRSKLEECRLQIAGKEIQRKMVGKQLTLTSESYILEQ
jgi:hypothetical protein